jgi:hypothetical protein
LKWSNNLIITRASSLDYWRFLYIIKIALHNIIRYRMECWKGNKNEGGKRRNEKENREDGEV